MMIATRRLDIRPIRPDDWPGLRRIALDFQASPYRIYDHEMPTADGKVQAAAAYLAGTGLFFAVFEAGSAEMIGYVCFHIEGGSCDMGYCFHSSVHGRGYAFEACSTMMELLSQACGIRRFTAGTALVNAPSMRLLERLGFEKLYEERVCFYEGCPFTGGFFAKNMD